MRYWGWTASTPTEGDPGLADESVTPAVFDSQGVLWENWWLPECLKHSGSHGATTGIRTLDLSLTKALQAFSDCTLFYDLLSKNIDLSRRPCEGLRCNFRPGAYHALTSQGW